MAKNAKRTWFEGNCVRVRVRVHVCQPCCVQNKMG